MLSFDAKADDNYFRNEVNSSIRYLPHSSVNHQDGKLSFLEMGGKYKYEVTTDEAREKQTIPFSVSVGFNDTELDTKDLAVTLPSRLVGWTANVGTTLPFFNIEKTYIGIGISPGFFGDEWGMDIDDFRFSMRTYLVYHVNEKLMVVGGVGIKPKYEYPVWPIVGFIYKPTEKWTINFLSKKPKVLYHYNEKLDIFAEGDFSYGEYIVENLDAKHAVLRYQNYHVGGGASYRITDNIRIIASCGGYFGGILRYKEKNRGKINLGNGFYADSRLSIQF